MQTEAEQFWHEWHSYLVTHGQSLNAYRWLAVKSQIGLEKALIDQGRQTVEQAEKIMHTYLTLIGI